MNDNTLDNPFWQYACALYQKPGVSNTLLQLQDKFGWNIPVALLLIWLGSRGIAVSIEDIKRFVATIDELDTQVIKPLRVVRRYIKSSDALMPENYEHIKALELSVEQQIMALIYRQSLLISSASGATSSAGCNLKLYISTGSTEQQRLVQTLLGQIM